EPLGLDTLGFGAPTNEDTTEVPWGHRKLGPVKIAADPAEGADNPPWMAAAGTMHMTLDDLLTYGQAHLDSGTMPDAILTPETFTRLHTPRLNDYAYGWVIQSRDLGGGEEQIIWHNGSNTMWYALLVLLPERNAAITLVTNDGSQLNQTQRRFDAFAMEIAEAIAARG
ncbi:MAG: serine hydrolase, partial [Pseudomonadota bacterium]